MTDEVTGQEVAQLLGIKDPAFVRRLRIDGRLPGLRQVGITWLYSRKVVLKFLATWDREPGSYLRKRAGKPSKRVRAKATPRRTPKGIKPKAGRKPARKH